MGIRTEAGMSIPLDSEQYKAAQNLLRAAYEYWQIYQENAAGGTAVVYLKDDGGHMVMFTRGEYVSDLLRVVHADLMSKPPLERPFEKNTN